LDRLGGVIDSMGTPSYWARLHAWLVEVTPHGMGGAFVYQANDPPVRIFDSVGSPRRDRIHAILAKVGYLLSPYYNGLIRPRAPSGFYRLEDVEPDEFRDSEYHRVYYGRKGVSDEGMFLVRVNDDLVIVVMVERTTDEPLFEAGDVARQRAISPVVSALVTQQVRLVGIGEAVNAKEGEVKIGFRDVMERFGAELLSKREREVAMLILRGHSSKSAASILDISSETERVHRRRLYSRLGIASHSELFWLFFEATEHFDPVARNDPLLDYLRQTKPELVESVLRS